MKSFGEWVNDLAGSVPDTSEVTAGGKSDYEPVIPLSTKVQKILNIDLDDFSIDTFNAPTPPQHVIDKLPEGAVLRGVDLFDNIWAATDDLGSVLLIDGDNIDDMYDEEWSGTSIQVHIDRCRDWRSYNG